MKRILIALGVVAVLVVIVVASMAGGDRQKRTKVYAEEVVRRDISQVVKTSGQINPRIKVNISAHVVGKIERLFAVEGQQIDAGEPFLELEKESFVAARDNARAQLAIERSRLRQAEIDLADAELKLRRAERLSSEGITSHEALEAASIQRQAAELQRQRADEAILQAQANLDKAADDLRKTTIFSPLDGRVIELRAEEGEVVVPGTMNNTASVIGVVADLSEILAEVAVDETEIVDVELGQSALVMVDALPDVEYRGTVVEIGSSGFARPQQPDVTFFSVEILLTDPDERLRPGMSARAEIEIATHEDVPVVPIQAVVERRPLDEEAADGDDAATVDEEEIEVVFVVGENDVAVQTPVETGISDDTHIEIVAGVEAGERVVSGPYRALKDLDAGDLLTPRTEGEDDADGDEGDEAEDDE